MAKNCLTHKDAPAITMCTQCHNPICQACTVVTPTGRFCSSECSILYKEMKTRLAAFQTRGGGGGAVKAFAFLLVLAVAAMLVIHIAAQDKPGDHWLKKADVIGRYILKKPE